MAPSMTKRYLWTTLRARLEFVRSTPGRNYNWLFLPGGPGLGSESLSSLTKILQVPGTLWHIDLPGDGSNQTADNVESFRHWSAALVELCGALDSVILVAHSTGGMYALATPALEKILTGLVLMDSAPDASWQEEFMRYTIEHPLTEMLELQRNYAKNPSNALLKAMTLASAPYLFRQMGPSKDLSFLEDLPYNHQVCDWSAQNFDQTYRAQWSPKTMQTLVFAGEDDPITPLKLFTQSKDFQRDNCVLKSIAGAGHFPWLENPKQVIAVFEDYWKNMP